MLSFAFKSCTVHLNRSASDPLICCTIKLRKLRPVNASISAPGPKRLASDSRGKEASNTLKTWHDGRSQPQEGRAHLLNDLTAKMARC